MKVITAKEFQAHHARVMQAVKAGETFQVTFHRKPFVTLTPTKKQAMATKPKPGSYEAVMESLKHTSPSKNIPPDADLKELRWQYMQEKYGKYIR